MIYYNPDIITGYNIFGFDDNYINTKANFYSAFDKEIFLL